jgi:hypothetical protein
VRARLAQYQAQRGLGAWLSRLGFPTWALVLAAGLVLSLGLNVWWGLHTLKLQAPGTQQGTWGMQVPEAQQKTDPWQEAGGSAQRLHIARFQRQIQPAQGLGTFVAAHSALREPAAIAAFTPQAARTAFVRLGTLYAEALATLASDDVEATSLRLVMLVQILVRVQAPPVLPQYLRTVHGLLPPWARVLEGEKDRKAMLPGEKVATILALFEPLYEDAYAGANAQEPIRLFQAGAWLENMSLAAAARDAAALRYGGAALEEVRNTLTHIHAPPEALTALARVQRLLAQSALTEDELRTIQNLVQDIQERLSD